MGERWDFYFCTVDDRPASIFVNLDLEREAPLPGLSYVASVRILMKNPRPDGLSSADEAAALKQIEDTLNAEVRRRDPAAVFVGRNTSGGKRDLFFYVPAADWWVALISAAPSSVSGYKIEADVWEDRSWETYFDFLLPNDEQKQTIQNSDVCEQMEQRGDPRPTTRDRPLGLLPSVRPTRTVPIESGRDGIPDSECNRRTEPGRTIRTPNLSGGPAFVQCNRRSHIALVSLSTGTRRRIRRLGDGGPEAKLKSLAELGCW